MCLCVYVAECMHMCITFCVLQNPQTFLLLFQLLRSTSRMTTVVTVHHLFFQMLPGQMEVGGNGHYVLGGSPHPNPANKNKMKTIVPCLMASDEMRRGSLLFMHTLTSG